MAYLPLANILHHKLRSFLSAAGIGCGICMLVTLSGLARGSLNEVADRWEAVSADLIVYPGGWGRNMTTLAGIGVPDSHAGIIRQKAGRHVSRVVPVFLWPMRLGGQDQLAAGVDADDFAMLTGGRPPAQGRLFDPNGTFAAWLEELLLSPAEEGAEDEPLEIDSRTAFAHPAHDGLELVIDTRLAGKTNLGVGEKVTVADHEWEIVGIVPAGGMSRVYLPRRTAQYLFGAGSIQRSTLLFVELTEEADRSAAARAIREATGAEVVPLEQYRAMLEEKFGVLYRYVDAVNVVALVIAFLFIMNTLYTMVLQRTRDVAILKSCGAPPARIVAQVMAESLLLTGLGAAMGIAASFAAGWAITTYTLYTVNINPTWIAVALLAAAAGAIISALYPAYQAARVDVLEALTLE